MNAIVLFICFNLVVFTMINVCVGKLSVNAGYMLVVSLGVTIESKGVPLKWTKKQKF